MGRFDQRITSVELRPINLLTSDQVEAAVTIAPPGVSPSTIVTGTAPNQFRKVQDAYLYPKKLTGLSEDRVEIYLESDLELEVGETVEVSGIHGSSTEDIDVDGTFEIKAVDTPPWTGRASYAHDPEDDQLPAVTISNTYSFKPDTVAPTTLSARRRLQTKRLVSTYAITATTVTLTMNAAHKFKAGDIVFIDIFAEDSRAYGVDGLFEIDSVTSNTIVYTLPAGVDTPVTATAPAADVYVFPVARNYIPVGSTWANSSNNKIFYWDGIRWIDYSVVDAVADGDPPSPPTNLNVSSDITFFQTATPIVEVTVSWTAPTTNESGSALTDLLGYTIKARRNTSDPWKVVNIPFTTGTSYTFDAAGEFEPNTLYYFEVYAYDSGNLYSAALTGTHTTAAAPNTNIATIRPTPISAEVYLGTITLSWDGDVEDASNTPQTKPAGLVYLDLHVSNTAGFTPSSATLLTSMSAVPGNSYVYADVTYGNSYYFRGILRDAVGTNSLPSRQTTAQAQSTVDVAAIAGIIDAANITPGTLVTGQDIVGISITGQIIKGLEINAGLIQANSITANQINAGSISAALVQSGSFRTAASGARVEFNSSGIYGYNSSNGITFRVLSSNGSVFIASGVTIGGYATSGELGTVNTTAINANTTATSANTTAVTANNVAQGIYSNIYVPGTTEINGGVIRTGTIEASRIVAGSITATQISSSYIYAGTISASQVSAGTFIGSTFKTADGTAKRVLVSGSSNSIKFYNTGDSDANERGAIEGTSTGMLISGRSSASLLMGSNVVDATSGTSRMLLSTSAGLYTNSYGSLSAGSGTTEVVGPGGSSVSMVLLNSQMLLNAVQAGATPAFLFAGSSDNVRIENLSGSSASTVSAFSTGTLYRGTGSDERLKENILELSNALDIVNSSRPVTFNYKNGTGFGGGTHYGVIAQELQANLPEDNTIISTTKIEVEGDETDYLTVEYQRLIPVAMAAIKELSSKVTALETRIATLEGTT